MRYSFYISANCTTLKKYAEEFGCDIMEITAHAGARPEHAAWQGQLVSLSGKRGYLTLSDIQYGEGAGFMGWNCRHNWNPFFPGISRRNYDKDSLEKLTERNVLYNGKKYTDYEISQIQRSMERDIRATKRVLAGLDESIKNSDGDLLAGLRADFNSEAVKLKAKESKLKDLLEQTGNLPDNARVQVLGFGKSQAQKAVWANKAELEKYTKIHYHKDGTIVVTDDWKGKNHVSAPQTYKPYAVIETTSNRGHQIDRTIYSDSGKIQKQIHSGPHGRLDKHPYGESGEHIHIYSWSNDSKHPDRTTGELTAQDRVEHKDILGGERK